MFTQPFDSYVVDGDYIQCEVEGFLARATLHHDADTKPEEDNPALDAWRKDEWHYFGCAVTVWRDGIQLTGTFDHALWGIEGNYPAADPRGNTNSYFVEVANDHLADALADAKARIAKWAKECAA